MKRLALLVAAVVGGVFWFGLSAPAFADNGPHYSSAGNTTVDRCAGCHRAHTAQGENLLRQEQPALCYTCHGSGAGGASTDVQEGVGYNGFERGSSFAGALRGGGFEFALIDSSHGSRTSTPRSVPVLTSGQPTTSSHTVDGTPGTAWGNGAVWNGSATGTDPGFGKGVSLRCGSCHDPHGNGNYRILKPVPNDSGAAAGVTIPDSPTKVYTTTNYWLADDPNSPLGAPISVPSHTPGAPPTVYTPTLFITNISAWCSQCHTRYMAPSGSSGVKSGDPTFMYRHATSQNYKAPGANCITCHVAHGTNANMSGPESSKVTNPDGTTVTNPSKLLRVDNRGTCNMCHNV